MLVALAFIVGQGDRSPTPELTPAPEPLPSPTVFDPPPPGTLEVVGAGLAIVLALAAAFLAYRVLRGGRGL